MWECKHILLILLLSYLLFTFTTLIIDIVIEVRKFVIGKIVNSHCNKKEIE